MFNRITIEKELKRLGYFYHTVGLKAENFNSSEQLYLGKLINFWIRL